MNRWVKILLWTIAALVVLGVLVFNMHLRTGSELEAYRKQLRAAGEKLTIEELMPPAVAADANSAELLERAGDELRRLHTVVETNAPRGMLLIAPGKATAVWKQADVGRRPSATNSWDEIGLALQQHEPALVLLDQLPDPPVFYVAADHTQVVTMLMPDLALTKRAAQVLIVAALHDLHVGDTASAVRHERTALALVKGWENDRWAITQLVRLAVTAMIFNLNWEILQAGDLTDEQLAALQNDWSELEFMRAQEQAIQMSRAVLGSRMDRVRRGEDRVLSPRVPSSSGGPIGWWDGMKTGTSELMWRNWWSYPDELRALKGFQVLLESLRSVQTNYPFSAALADQEAGLKALGIGVADDWGWLDRVVDGELLSRLSQSIESLGSGFSRLIRSEVVKRLSITAIALKRYHLAHGRYPSALSDLVPQFLPEIPRDPMDGNLLRYRSNPDGTFVLYSVGQDGVDDGGDPAQASSSRVLSWERGRDYVWPMPATDAEIEAAGSASR